MIINMTGGGGGDALNFKVVPGLTQPGTASENTIWVKTEQIGDWCFSTTQPEGMQEWDVWFPTGIESVVEFNALKKNALQVYPLIAKQMVSGELVVVNVMSYQHGEWVDWWNGELYNKGNEFEHITGGWAVSNFLFANSYTFAIPTFTKSGNTLKITNSSTNATGASITHKNALDLTGYKKVFVNITALSSVDRQNIAVMPEGSKYANTDAIALVISNTQTGTVELSLGNFDTTKKYFVVLLTTDGTNGTGSITVDKVWLE